MEDFPDLDGESDFTPGAGMVEGGATEWASPSQAGGRSSPPPPLPTVGQGAKYMLDRLSESEGTGEGAAREKGFDSGYDVSFGYRARPDQKPLSGMTLDEVAQLQAQMRHTPVGRYQITKQTLEGLRDRFQLSGDAVFSPGLQDQLGRQLMKQRGYDNSQLTPDELQSHFSREWASVPTLNGHSIDPRQPVGMSSAAFQQYLAKARALDARR